VTVGAGVQFWQLYDQAWDRKRMVVGGTCSTVGHAGFTLAGGYGDYSRMYGSGATNLVEAEVVLADGRIVIASACGPHADLFRAMRGGGGAFGLMTKATYKTYPMPLGKLGSAEGKIRGLQDGLARFLSWYAGVVRRGLSKHFGGQVVVGGRAGDAVAVQLNYNGLTQHECTGVFAELSQVKCRGGDRPSWKPAKAEVYPNGAEGWQPSWENGDAFAYHTGSAQRYFELHHAEDPAFAPAVARIAETSPKGLVLALNYALGHGSEMALANASDTTVHPQVYTAIGALKLEILQHDFVPTATTAVEPKKAANFATLRAQLEAVVPGAGSYYNEGDYLTQAFQTDFWGSSYPELAATKVRYDPRNVFTCHQCVGSENSPASCGRRLGGDADPVLV